MHDATHPAEQTAMFKAGDRLGLDHLKLGMWLFLASEVMFFGGLISAFLHFKINNPSPESSLLDVVIVGINTFVLLASSLTVVLGLAAIQRGDRRGLMGYLVATIILGFANLLADGFSMAISNYQGVKTRQDEVERARRTEHGHIDKIPQGEREEIRQIFAAKGFEGDLLERVVHVITNNREVWVNTMLTDELGIQPVTLSPIRAGIVTFASFLLVGAAPLLPFLFVANNANSPFMMSAGAAAVAFFAVGAFRGRMLEQRAIMGGLSTLVTGGAAATVAYLVGWWLRQQFGVAS